MRDAGGCEPIENAVVDIWHCDALGGYSGFDGQRRTATTYLRGAQVTNGDGVVEFKTIYPGWYPGRTVHIHAKVHLDNQTVLTTQLFTTREYDDKVFAREPYAQRSRPRHLQRERRDLRREPRDDAVGDDGDGVLGVMTFDVERA